MRLIGCALAGILGATEDLRVSQLRDGALNALQAILRRTQVYLPWIAFVQVCQPCSYHLLICRT